MRKIRLSLRWKIFIVVSIGLLVVYSLVGAFRIHHIKKSFAEEIDRSGQERVALIADAVANMVVKMDYVNLESIADRVVNLQDVQKINIFNQAGRLMVTRNNRDFVVEKIDLDNPGALFVAPVLVAAEKIGSVELIVTRNRFDELISRSYATIFTAILLATSFFGVLIYFTMTALIARPLTRLSKAAEQLAIGNYAAELPPDTGDEIGSLVQTFSAMRESRKLNEARLRTVIDHSPDAFIQLDSNGNIIDWNDKAESIWGYRKNEVLGKNFSVVLPEHELGLNGDYSKSYQHSENIIGVIRELNGRCKDGRFFPLELITSEIHVEEDFGYLVTARDITNRKENESKLLNAMNAAEAANAAKSTFLSNMSHEIRTPMNSIIGMTKLAINTSLDAKQQDYLSKIDYSAIHLLGLINDILDFSKIEAHKLELETLDFKLSEIFKNLSAQLSLSAANVGLRLVFDLDERLSIPLRGDPMRLSQILLNYTTNAIKFSELSEVIVSGQLLEECAGDVLLRFEVRDKGIGLYHDEIDRLFKPFQQADLSVTRKYGGTGLGLAICKQLAELMGGTVGVDSQPGLGSTFWFSVRLAKGDKQNETLQAPPITEMQLLKDATVLLVEDNLFNQQVAVEMLREAGVNVSIANNGQEAIDRLETQHFDCVLMDVQMPVMDGLEATRQIRGMPALADNCIIAMTANAGNEDRARCFAAGMDHFISKPVYAENLYAAIAQCLPAVKLHHVASGDTAMEVKTAPPVKPDSRTSTAQALNAQQAVVDLSVLSKMLGSDPAKVRKFALKFLQSAQQGLTEIELALHDADFKVLAALGHRNKSPARTVGAYAYAALCESLEKFKDGGAIEQARLIVTGMHQMLAQIAEQINRDTSQD